MKAIQIRFLPPTNFKPARVKVFAEGVKDEIHSYQYGLDFYRQAEMFAQDFAYNKGWGEIKGIGQLPNGDCVATLELANQ